MTTSSLDAVRLGLIVPGDCHVDDEFWRLAVPEAIPYVTRTLGASDVEMGRDAISETTALAEGSEIAMAARRLRDVTPAIAAYVDTSISFVRGSGGDHDIAQVIRAELSCPAVVTSTAVAAALATLEVSRMAVLSPYPADLDARLVTFFESYGVQTASVRTMQCAYPTGATSLELGRIQPEELIAEGVAAMDPSADALFIPCTAIRALGAIDSLERSIGRPVVTAIQATLWATLRMVGIAAARPDLGILFAKTDVPERFAQGMLTDV